MDAATKAQLLEGSRALGVALTGDMVEKLGRYLVLLQKWSKQINLTAILKPAEVIDRHFLDSLAVSPFLERARTLLDVGSGAGFPGAVLAVARPALKVTCIDSIQKKVSFLQTLRREVAPNLEPICTRLEKLGPRTFDAVVSRATWKPPIWVGEGAPFVDRGGLLIAMQTTDQPELTPPPNFTALVPVEYEIDGAHRRIQVFQRYG